MTNPKSDRNIQNFLRLLMFFMIIPVSAQLDKRDAQKILEKYAGEEYEIISRYEKLPVRISWKNKDGHIVTTIAGNDPFKYLNYTDELTLLRSMPLNVHEVNHMFTSTWAGEWANKNNKQLPGNLNYYFYISRDAESITAIDLKFFPSRVLIDHITEKFRTIRFGTYINGNSSTQGLGLIGLLDEFNSYLHSYKTAFLLQPAYLQVKKFNLGKNYLNWLMDIEGWIQPYYEFRFFILEYLLYARRFEPIVYETIRKNPVLIQIFNTITEKYYPLVKQGQYELTDGHHRFAVKNNLEVDSNPGREIMFRNGNTSSGFRLNSKAYFQLFEILHSNRYDLVTEELGIKKFKEECYGL